MRQIIDTEQLRGNVLTGVLRHKATVSTTAIMMALAAVQPAWATIDNTVTVNALDPGGAPVLVPNPSGDPLDPDVPPTADEQVDVIDDNTSLLFVKTVTLPDGTTAVPADAAVGTEVQYQFAVTNTSNVTITAVNITELSFDGDGSIDPTDATVTNDFIDGSSAGRTTETTNDSTDGAAGDGVWDTLAPGDTITFTSSYTVTQNDITDNGDGDGALDNDAEATGQAPASTGVGAVTSNNDTATFDLEDQDASLTIAKLADDDTEVVVGQLITYTYTVTNDGNVPISNVNLTDNVTAGSGGNPTPVVDTLTNTSGDSVDDVLTTGVVEELAPGDSVTFTGEYTVTQSDIDNLQ